MLPEKALQEKSKGVPRAATRLGPWLTTAYAINAPLMISSYVSH
jgi:hypothetical protein